MAVPQITHNLHLAYAHLQDPPVQLIAMMDWYDEQPDAVQRQVDGLLVQMVSAVKARRSTAQFSLLMALETLAALIVHLQQWQGGRR